VVRRIGEPSGAWRALGACVITIVLAAGSRTSLAAFLRPIEADLHLDRGVLSTAGALTVLTYGLAQPLVGALASRFGPRNVMVGSVVSGPLADRMPPGYLRGGLYLIRAVSFPLLLLTGPDVAIWALGVFALLFGPTYIANQAPGARLVRDRYGCARSDP
jgi:MFS family permease